MPQSDVILTVRLPAKLLKQIDKVAKAADRSRSSWLRHILQEQAAKSMESK